MMKTSEHLDLLLASLARARLNFGEIKKSKTNPHFKSTYAALDDIIPAIAPALATEGLLLIGDLCNISEGIVTVTTRLMHTSEQWIESTVDLSYQFGKLQDLGREITYARRYSINTMLALWADEDLDEQQPSSESSGRTRTRQPSAPRPAAAPPPTGHDQLTLDEINSLIELSKGCGLDLAAFGHDVRRLLGLAEATKITKIFLQTHMTKAQYQQQWDAYTARLANDVAQALDDDDVPLSEPPQQASGDTHAFESSMVSTDAADVTTAPVSTAVMDHGKVYATDEQLDELQSLARRVGDDAVADVQDILDHHPNGMVIDVYQVVRARMEARVLSAKKTTKA